jgi:hypothetical protein
MAVYRLIALLADPNTLRCVNTQVYQARGVLLAKVALHFLSFLALATHKKGVSHATQDRNTPTKSTKRRLPPPLCAWLCSVKRSRLLLRVLSFGYAFASASAWLLLLLSVRLHLLVLRLSAQLQVRVQLQLSLCCPVPSAH